MAVLELKGRRIHYEMAGCGRTPLVLLHGNFASWRWWQPVFERLPAPFVAYAPVMRGCNGSPSNLFDGFEISLLAEDLELFVDALGLRRFHLVAHSLGGAVA
jgi:3-oxoadipate enol-lactonase